MAGIQQLSTQQVAVRLENVPFSEGLAWLYDLEKMPEVAVGDIGIRPAASNQSEQVSITVGLGLRN